MRRSSVVAAVLALTAARVHAQCSYTDGASGAKYDLSALRAGEGGGKNYFTATQGSDTFNVAVCQPVQGSCEGLEQPAAVLVTAASTCRSLGKTSTAQWQAIDSAEPERGVRIAFTGGSPCPTGGSPSRSTYELRCAKSAGATTVTVEADPVQQCSYTFVFSTKAACPDVPGTSAGTYAVVIFLITAIVYCGFGALYKWRVKGTSGLESVPNIDFWRAALKYVTAGVNLCLCRRPRTQHHDAYDRSLMEDAGGADVTMERI